MNYRNVYLKIISNAKAQNRKKCKDKYYEAHHILPKSIFPSWKDRKSNIVLLTAREHLFCHMLLSKIYDCHEMKAALFFMITNGKHKCTLREYERIKLEFSRSNSLHLKGKKNPNMKRTFSEETKSKLSAALKGKPNVKDRGKHWFTNGETDVFAFECPDGFRLGRSANKGKAPWNKDKHGLAGCGHKVGEFKHSEESKKRMSEAHKGKEPWNKKS